MKTQIISIFALILLIGVISAEPFPMPTAYYGDITINNVSIPNGYFLTAKIGNALGAECPILDGSYGKTDNPCFVVTYQETGLIIFYIGSTEIGRATFVKQEITRLDFNLLSLPNYTGNSANGICEVELGECYFNLLDCDAATTKVCAGNNVCDTLIGETCSNAPQDCGACPSSPSPGSGGSGGGGGGGHSSTPAVTTINTSKTENITNVIKLSANNSPSNEDDKTNESVSGTEKGSFLGQGTIAFIVVIIILLAIITFIVSSRKGEDRKIKEVISDIAKDSEKKGDETKKRNT